MIKNKPGIHRILDAATDLFTKSSFNSVSMIRVSQLADCTQPLIHYHFGKKKALFFSVLDKADVITKASIINRELLCESSPVHEYLQNNTD